MKVLLINNLHYRRGGADVVYLNTAKIMQDHGHEVIFFSRKVEGNIPCEQQGSFCEGPKCALNQLITYFYNKDAAKCLERLVEAEKPDIAHAHLLWCGIGPSIFHVLQKHNIPLVHTAHDYRMVCPGYTFKDGAGNACERCKHWNYYQCAIHKCSKDSLAQSIIMATEMYTRQMFHNPIKNIQGFVFVSHFSEQKHIQHNSGFKDAKHVVLYNYTKPALEFDNNAKEDYFLFYGRLSFEKGIPKLLRVFAKHPELKLKVVGTGPLEKELREQYEGAPTGASLEAKKCYENIEFLGYHSEGSLFELVRNAKFICVPSECYENNPMTIIESYSLGTPVIGANIGGIPEIIDEGKTGFLFESGNVDALENAILRANEYKCDEYEDLCKGAYEFFQHNFSEEMHYQRLIGFYEDLLNNKL